MRSYDVTIVSLAIGATRKWTDNVISQHVVSGVRSSQRGVSRLVPHSTLIRLAIIRALHVEIGMGVRDAVRFAARLYDETFDHETGGYDTTEWQSITVGHVSLAVDVNAVEQDVDARLREALESAPALRRGRPAFGSLQRDGR